MFLGKSSITQVFQLSRLACRGLQRTGVKHVCGNVFLALACRLFFLAVFGRWVTNSEGELLHQNISKMEKRYEGIWSPYMQGEACHAPT